jgi:tetratricopeptide (TPR) repeat protein
MLNLELRRFYRALGAVLLYAALAAAEDPSQIAQQASNAMQAQDYPKAERLYAELAHSIPNVPEVFSNLGLARYYQKEFKTGQKAFESALRLNPNLFVPNFFLAKIDLGSGRYAQALPLAEKAIKAQPKDRSARRLVASILVGLKREDEAISEYQNLLESDPRDADSLYDLALVYLDLGKSAYMELLKYKQSGFVKFVSAEHDAQREGFQEVAVEEYRQAIAASPELPGLRVALGNLLLRSGKWQESEQAFQEELIGDPFSYEANFGLAVVSLRQQRCDGAVRFLDEAVAIRPEFFDPLPDLDAGFYATEIGNACRGLIKSASGHESFGTALLLSKLLQAEGQSEQAAAWQAQAEGDRDELIQKFKTQQASGTFATSVSAAERRSLGATYLQHKRYAEGLTVLSPLLANSSVDQQIDLLVARSFFALERYADLLKVLNCVHFDDPESYYLRGASCQRLALHMMNRLAEIDPQSARSHQLLASSFIAQQVLPEAVREYETALKIQPNDPELYYALGNTYFKQRNFLAAEAAYAHAINLNPLHAEARAMEGCALVELKRPDEAVPLLRQALQLDPGIVSAHAFLGKALAETGRDVEAVRQLELAKATDVDGSLHYQLATLYRKLGATEKARQELLASERIRQKRRQAMDEGVVLPASHDSQSQ